MLGWMKHRLESRLPGEISINLRYADDTILMAEREEELKSFLMKVKEEWKSWFKTQHSENEDHGIWSHRNSWKIDGETMETVTDFIFGAPKSLHMVSAAMKLKDACSLEDSYDQPRQHIKKQRHYFANKEPSSQSYGFSSSHVWMWELDNKKDWPPKNAF